jgi:uncharacterized protein (TIGR03790 family)
MTRVETRGAVFSGVLLAAIASGAACSSSGDPPITADSTDGGPATDSAPGVDAKTDAAGPDGATPTSTPTFLAPRESLTAAEVGVLVNADDPQSVAVGDHYVKARGVPAANLISLHLGATLATAKTTTISSETFALWKTQIDAATPKTVQAFAVTWIYPSVVQCMSLTSALAFGFDTKWCTTSGQVCGSTAASPYFNSAGTTPQTTHSMRPAMVVAGATTADAITLIDRGVSADGTYPLAKGYLVRTDDGARSVRFGDFMATNAAWNKPDSLAFEYIDNSASGTGLVESKSDVLFYFTGFASVGQIATNKYLPGAMADHLTSYGGQIPESGQMSILRWLEAGATGSSGTVVEPCNYTSKFSQVSVAVAKYFAGATLLEAYWKSVAWPGESLFIGEPLARPYGTRATFANGTLTIRTTSLLPSKVYRVESATVESGPWTTVLDDLKVTTPALKTIAVPFATAPFYRLTTD